MNRIESIFYKGVGQNVLSDSVFGVMPHNRRQRFYTPIILVKDISMCTDKVLLRKIGELDFWNEISGFIHMNVRHNHKVYDFINSGIEIPDDVEVKTFYSINGLDSPLVAGSIFIDADYNVYICYGFINQHNSDVYLDFA